MKIGILVVMNHIVEIMNIYNVTDASIGAAIETDNKIAEYLNKYKPIKAEIDNLKDDLGGAYSSFIGSPIK